MPEAYEYRYCEEDLPHIIRNFNTSELKEILKYAGRDTTGSKVDLRRRALGLLKLHSQSVTMKLFQIYEDGLMYRDRLIRL